MLVSHDRARFIFHCLEYQNKFNLAAKVIVDRLNLYSDTETQLYYFQHPTLKVLIISKYKE